MTRSTTPMKVAKSGYIGISLILIALGVCMICFPGVSIRALGIAGGAVLIAFGIIKLIGYFSGDLFRLAFQYDLASGILAVLVGIALLVRPVPLAGAFCAVAGLMVLADGLFKIQITIEAKRFGIRKWWLILVSALLAGVLGLALILFPDKGARTMMAIFGIMMIAEGILNICTMITAVKIIRHQHPDIIEAEYVERKD